MQTLRVALIAAWVSTLSLSAQAPTPSPTSSPTGSPAIYLSDGFESGGLASWVVRTGGAGTVAVTTSPVKTGT